METGIFIAWAVLTLALMKSCGGVEEVNDDGLHIQGVTHCEDPHCHLLPDDPTVHEIEVP